MRPRHDFSKSSCSCGSFVDYEDLYSAFSRLLPRSSPDPCRARKNSFEARVECVRMNPGEQSQCQWKPISHGRANHRECTGLPCGSTSKRNKDDPRPIERRELRPMVPRVVWKRPRRYGRIKVKRTPPDQGSDAEYD